MTFSIRSVDRINESPYKVCLALAGGGQSFIHHFMRYPGASKTIADIRIPYGKEAFEEFCGKKVLHFVSEDAARLLATKSYVNCCKSIDPEYAVGIGLTCSLATSDERVSRTHRIHLVVHCFNYTELVSYELAQGLDRETEEGLCADLILDSLLDLVYGSSKRNYLASFGLQELARTCHRINRSMFTTTIEDDVDHVVLVPGSFNPFHNGHKQMLDTAKEILDVEPTIELTTVNADKGTLDYFDVMNRVHTVPSEYPVLLTAARTFVDKAQQFARPGRKITFVIGADTWNRILEAKYAGPTVELYAKFTEMNVQFLVFGRAGTEINYSWFLSGLMISDKRALNYNNPISSTAIREGKNG